MAEQNNHNQNQTETNNHQQQNQNQQNQQNQQTQTQSQQTETQKVDVDKIKNDALSDFLKGLGIDDEVSLKDIVDKHKQDEESKKTDLEKKNDELSKTRTLLIEEREARIIAEAKLSAIQLGAKPELVDDLVIVAKSKVTKDKDISAVITEMKDSESGKIYFVEKEEESNNQNKKTTVTRQNNVTKNNQQTQQQNQQENNQGKHTGSMAERLLAGRKPTKNFYYK